MFISGYILGGAKALNKMKSLGRARLDFSEMRQGLDKALALSVIVLRT